MGRIYLLKLFNSTIIVVVLNYDLKNKNPNKKITSNGLLVYFNAVESFFFFYGILFLISYLIIFYNICKSQL